MKSNSLFAVCLSAMSVVGLSAGAVPGLEVASYDQPAYATVTVGGAWRIGIVNHADRLVEREIPPKIERHLTSDESFVLVAGSGRLVMGENVPFDFVPLETGRVYTVKKGFWHAVMTSPGAKIFVIEDADVSDANTERRLLDATRRLPGGLVDATDVPRPAAPAPDVTKDVVTADGWVVARTAQRDYYALKTPAAKDLVVPAAFDNTLVQRVIHVATGTQLGFIREKAGLRLLPPDGLKLDGETEVFRIRRHVKPEEHTGK